MGEKLIKKISKIVPIYAVIPLISCFLINNIVYFGLRMLVKEAHHYDLTTPLDRMVPFIPAWVSIYFICYLFWIVNYILIGRTGEEHLYRFVAADILSRLICGIFFVLLPTTNVRPQITGGGIWDILMQWLYAVDEPTNLFPSIHCLCSWYCYIGIRGQANIPRWYQKFSLVFAILVCLSTQFTKQHYLIDIAGGIGLAQLCYMFCSRGNFYLAFRRFFEQINDFMWKEGIWETNGRTF